MFNMLMNPGVLMALILLFILICLAMPKVATSPKQRGSFNVLRRSCQDDEYGAGPSGARKPGASNPAPQRAALTKIIAMTAKARSWTDTLALTPVRKPAYAMG